MKVAKMDGMMVVLKAVLMVASLVASWVEHLAGMLAE